MQPDEMIQAARGLRPCDLLLVNSRIVNVFYTLPAWVPATDTETADARLDAPDLEEFFDDPRVVGLG